MALSNIQRARIIFDLLRDGEVANQAAYANVDMAPAALTLKYAAAMYQHGAALAPGAAPTNDQLAAGFLRALRLILRSAAIESRVPAAGRAAANAEETAVLGETRQDLGE